MDPKYQFQNQDYLRRDQYKNSQNLGDRAQLHHRFSSNPMGWENWIFPFLNLQIRFNVLECGAGPAWLWRNSLDKIPVDCSITITDLSPGMVAEAQNSLALSDHNFKFEEADIMNLPFGDNSYDVVVANHMLYHVSDRDKALSEVKRVLKPNGYLISTTVGKGHMRELHEMVNQLAPKISQSLNRFDNPFSLENGRAQLEPWFGSVEIHHYENVLNVTEVDPLLAYALSSSVIRALVDKESLRQLAILFENIIKERGAFTITTNSGLFKAKCKK